MDNKYLQWLKNEIEKTNQEITKEYNNFIGSNTREKIINGNTIELIRAMEIKLKTLETVKQMYEVYNT